MKLKCLQWQHILYLGFQLYFKFSILLQEFFFFLAESKNKWKDSISSRAWHDNSAIKPKK